MNDSSLSQKSYKLSRNILFFGFLLLLVYIVSAFFSNKGWLQIVKLNNKRNLIKREILAINAENNVLRKKIEAVRHESSYIENIAREELGMVKPGEVIYRFANEVERAALISDR